MHQDSDDEENDDNEEKASIKKEFSGRSPSPPAEDSEPEMTEEEKEFQLVSLTIQIFSAWRRRWLIENNEIHMYPL